MLNLTHVYMYTSHEVGYAVATGIEDEFFPI